MTDATPRPGASSPPPSPPSPTAATRATGTEEPRRSAILRRERAVMTRRLVEITHRSEPHADRPAIRTLIARRDPEKRVLLREAFDLDGRFRVIGEAHDGATVVALAAIDQPDVVVLDHDLALLTGLEAAAQILVYAPTARIVLLTGDAEVEARARRNGVHAVFGKAGSLRWLAASAAELVS